MTLFYGFILGMIFVRLIDAISGLAWKLKDWWLQRELRKVEDVYPGYISIVRSDEFEDWLVKQPQDTRDLCHSLRGKDAIEVLRRFATRT